MRGENGLGLRSRAQLPVHVRPESTHREILGSAEELGGFLSHPSWHETNQPGELDIIRAVISPSELVYLPFQKK